jgi:hypothetical protein
VLLYVGHGSRRGVRFDQIQFTDGEALLQPCGSGLPRGSVWFARKSSEELEQVKAGADSGAPRAAIAAK